MYPNLQHSLEYLLKDITHELRAVRDLMKPRSLPYEAKARPV